VSIYKFNSVFHQIDLSHLRYFFAIATFGGFSKASQATGLSQPALSLGLQKLEKTLQKELVDRTKRPFELTEAGKSLLAFCQRFQTQLESAISDLGTTGISVRRHIKVGTAQSIGFTYIDRMLASAKNNETIEWEFATQNTYELLEKVYDGVLDGAFVPSDVFDNRMHVIPIIQEKVIFVVSKKHPKRFHSKSWKSDISEIPLVTYPRDTPMRTLTDKICISENLNFKSTISTNSIEGLKLLVKNGSGAAFIQQSLIEDDLKNQEIRAESLPISFPKSGVSFVIRKESIHSANSELLIEILKQVRSRPK
jgi:DNA-binding transcriptional LysR family regulator